MLLSQVRLQKYQKQEHQFNRQFTQYLFYSHLLSVFQRDDKPNVALQYLKRALKIEVYSINDTSTIAGTHLNICVILSQLKKHENAAEHAQLAIELLQLALKTLLQRFPEYLERIQKLDSQNMMKKGTNEKQSQYINIVTTQIIAHYNLGTELEFLGKQTQALQIYQIGISLGAQDLYQNHPIIRTMVQNMEKIEAQMQQEKLKHINQLEEQFKVMQIGYHHFIQQNKNNERLNKEFPREFETVNILSSDDEEQIKKTYIPKYAYPEYEKEETKIQKKNIKRSNTSGKEIEYEIQKQGQLIQFLFLFQVKQRSITQYDDAGDDDKNDLFSKQMNSQFLVSENQYVRAGRYISPKVEQIGNYQAQPDYLPQVSNGSSGTLFPRVTSNPKTLESHQNSNQYNVKIHQTIDHNFENSQLENFMSSNTINVQNSPKKSGTLAKIRFPGSSVENKRVNQNSNGSSTMLNRNNLRIPQYSSNDRTFTEGNEYDAVQYDEDDDQNYISGSEFNHMLKSQIKSTLKSHNLYSNPSNQDVKNTQLVHNYQQLYAIGELEQNQTKYSTRGFKRISDQERKKEISKKLSIYESQIPINHEEISQEIETKAVDKTDDSTNQTQQSEGLQSTKKSNRQSEYEIKISFGDGNSITRQQKTNQKTLENSQNLNETSEQNKQLQKSHENKPLEDQSSEIHNQSKTF